MKTVNFLKQYYRETIILILTIILIFSIKGCSVKNQQINEKNNLITALNDSTKLWRDREGSKGESTPIRTLKTKEFIYISVKDPEIKRLQELVSKYKKQLNNQGVAGIYTGKTKIDTIWITKTDGRTIDSISNKWITSRFGFKDRQTLFQLKIRDSLSFIIGEESQGWFKSKKPFARVINYNPYSEVKEFKVYQVLLPKTKKFGVGPNISLGINSQLNTQLYFGIGLNYNIIYF